jgi:pimeloyl-ACP methyl ester carboxylesterase
MARRPMAAAIPGAELQVVTGVGHGGTFTHTAEVCGHVLEFPTGRGTR